ncbi:ATP-binding protein [Paenibacillus alginolyticus]|uniref:ATP-binding protein n=1 Tax=Paenibacillus alginolyticus TaxID=59839 RepID=A0ABT4GMZ0_9BACL|nr:ATP-binding protein [Paenibacillus alginolyticus]MCY9697588.1 ATP-binding protein [Paenibacillus alginolyticus]MEC0143344.1 ATP-binding protein [Paenibacillus alginolyticus]
MSVRKPLRGRIEFAEYKETGISDYKGFPMIEALPEILDVKDATKRIKVLKKFNQEELQLSASKRKHCVERISAFVIPLNKHLEVEQKLSIFIRKGYLSRNITNADHTRRMRYAMMHFKRPDIADLERERYKIPLPTSSGLGIIGISGAGKSTGIARILDIYPQIIVHEEYEEKQLVWMKIDCPVTGTIKQLCLNFIHEIKDIMGETDNQNYQNYKTDELIPLMSSLALQNHLGVLVIDEIQYLHEVKSGGAALMLNFFNTLINTIGVPIVLIGTPKARHLFTKEFRNIKRITDQGSVDWDRMKQDDNDWKTLLKFIWEHQWTLQKAELTPEIEDALYFETQGIPDLVIKIFKESQKRVIGNTELITSSVINSVAQDQFQILQPPLNALRSGKKSEMLKYLDIFMKYEPSQIITKEDKQVYADEYGINLEEVLYEQVEDQQLQEIISWLMNADFPEEVANSVAMETKVPDLNHWKRAAFQAALVYRKDETHADNGAQPPDADRPTNRSNKAERSHTSGLLKVLSTKPKDKNSTLYHLIKKAGYVQDVRSRLVLG